MTFQSKTNTITVGPGSDFVADSGAFFIKVLRDLALNPDAPIGLRNDWRTISTWLGSGDGELTPVDYERIGQAWRSYINRGVAPSVGLEKPFQQLARKEQAFGDVTTSVPPEVYKVFDRLMASDAEISEKRKHTPARPAPLKAPPADATGPRTLTGIARDELLRYRAYMPPPSWLTAGVLLSALFALAYSGVRSLLDGESFGGWVLNAAASQLGAAQIVLAPAGLILGIACGAFVYSVILRRLYFVCRCDVEPWRRLAFGTSAHWSYWIAVVPGTVIGLIALMILWSVMYQLPAHTEIGVRALRLFPALQAIN